MRDETIEVRLHGRGGQGTVTMAALLVDAAFRAGWHVLGFPSFGTERTGAPVAAFVRLSRAPIRDRSEVRRPRFVVVQDPTLAGAVDVEAGLEPDGIVILNATAAPDGFTARTISVPVSEIARRELGKPITSTAMLGVFAAVGGVVSIDDVCAAIDARFAPAIAERNRSAARAAFERARARTAVPA